MIKLNLILNMNVSDEQCSTCMLTKITRKLFPNVQRSSNILDLVHSDICEMNGQLTLSGKRYFITFIDNYSGYCYVYLLHSKDEALEKFKIYKNEVELHCKKFLKYLRSDRGGEYYSPSYSESTRIVHEVTAPYIPQQNGVAERKNKVLIEMIDAMLSNWGLGPGFWGEALLTACYILNRVPNKRSKTTPYEFWNK